MGGRLRRRSLPARSCNGSGLVQLSRGRHPISLVLTDEVWDGDVDQPADAKLVSAHPEDVTPGGTLERRRNGAFTREPVPIPSQLGFVFAAEGTRQTCSRSARRRTPGRPQRTVIDGIRSTAVAGIPSAAERSDRSGMAVLTPARGSSEFFARPSRARREV